MKTNEDLNMWSAFPQDAIMSKLKVESGLQVFPNITQEVRAESSLRSFDESAQTVTCRNQLVCDVCVYTLIRSVKCANRIITDLIINYNSSLYIVLTYKLES